MACFRSQRLVMSEIICIIKMMISNVLFFFLLFYGGGAPLKDFKIKKVVPNQLFKIEREEGSHPVLARYSSESDSLIGVKKIKSYGIEARNDEQAFALEALLNPDIKLVSLTGMAGTGKTLLALAAAIEQEQAFDQILLSRPVIPLQNQDMGFLPGDIKEKLGPYMLPLFDNLSVIKNSFRDTSKEVVRIEEMLRTEKLLISPLAYIRGRSLSNVFFIVDEAQNLTPHEIKTIITRAGEGSKLVFTGDIHQIDSPYLDIHSNGLTHLSEKMYGQELFCHINLTKGERSELSELAGKLL
jgi:PhoH-like ATPase